MIIYFAKNNKNGKIYIGQTKFSLKRRSSGHIYESFTHKNTMLFHKAIRKYGSSSFSWKVIYESDNKYIIDIMETFYIMIHHSHMSENGYNMSWGGEFGCVGYKHSKETRKNMSDAHKGISPWNKGKHTRPLTESEKKYLSGLNSGKNHPQYGIPKSEETKRKISEKKKGQKSSMETRRKQSQKMIGRKHTEESKEKMRASKKNISQETRDKLSNALKGIKRSDESRRKMSLSKQNISPETRKKMSLKKRKYSDDVIEKILKMRVEKMTMLDISLTLDIPKSTIQSIINRM